MSVLAVGLLLVMAIGCSTWAQKRFAAGQSHKVTEGETLYDIAKHHNVPLLELAQMNGLDASQQLRIGQIIYIPPSEPLPTLLGMSGPPPKAKGAAPPKRSEKRRKTAKRSRAAAKRSSSNKRSRWARRAAKRSDASRRSKKQRGTAKQNRTAGGGAPLLSKRSTGGKTSRDAKGMVNKGARHLMWPVAGGTLTGRFRPSATDPREGIDIAAPAGGKVQAAGAGTVLYVGNEGTRYGLIVILRHSDSLVTIYAHLARTMDKVEAGKTIARGQTIGTVGKSGGVSTPRLHFQVRTPRVAADPCRYVTCP
ncbi:MAG: M23 family metallopeptidase [Myxococcota bacterium]